MQKLAAVVTQVASHSTLQQDGSITHTVAQHKGLRQPTIPDGGQIEVGLGGFRAHRHQPGGVGGVAAWCRVVEWCVCDDASAVVRDTILAEVLGWVSHRMSRQETSILSLGLQPASGFCIKEPSNPAFKRLGPPPLTGLAAPAILCI